MRKKTRKGRGMLIPHPLKIDARRDVDLDYPGYDVAKALDDLVNSLGIEYLHLTPPENADSIRTEGLRSDSGEIYFVDTALVLAHVALTQVFTKDFHLFGLKDSEDLKIIPDDVGEEISGHQWIYQLGSIPPDSLLDLGHWQAAMPLDQFLPNPPKWIAEVREMPGLTPERRAEKLARMERGTWPTCVLAYLERIDEARAACREFVEAGTYQPVASRLQNPKCLTTKNRLRRRAKNLMVKALRRLSQAGKEDRRSADRVAGEIIDLLKREFAELDVEYYARPAFRRALLEY